MKINRKNIEKLFFLKTIILFSGILSLGACSGFGGMEEVEDAKLAGNAVCVLDAHFVGKRNPIKEYRMFVISAENGQLLKKIELGAGAALLLAKNERILLKKNEDFAVFDTQKMEEVQFIDKKYLEASFPDLAEGIAKTEFLHHFIKIVTNSGIIFQYYPFEKRIERASDAQPANIQYFAAYYQKAYRWNNGIEEPLFEIKPKNRGEERGYVQSVGQMSENGKIFSEDYFIEGNFLDIFSEEQLLFVRGYTTVARDAQALYCLDFSLRRLWKISSEEIGLRGDKVGFARVLKYGDSIIFNSGENWFSAEAKTGKIRWSQSY